MAASVHEISNLIDPVAVAARSEASQLGHKVNFKTTTFYSQHNFDNVMVQLQAEEDSTCPSKSVPLILESVLYLNKMICVPHIWTGLSDGQLL